MPEPIPFPSATVPVRRALISVHDKTGIAELARDLAAGGVRLVSTGGTAAHLRQAGLDVSLVEEETGFPEILGGRVKTLHPKIFGGVLADDTRADHARELAESSIEAFDLVVVSLYPFEQTVAGGASPEETIEMIDVGGTALIRAAAKNHARVAVLVDPSDYAPLMDEIRATGGTSLATRARLAARAFARTAAYDAAIAAYLSRTRGDEAFPENLVLSFQRMGSLRYGENPHQRAAVYGNPKAPPDALVHFQMLQGKELSFNNLLDLDAAVTLARDFDRPAAVIVKHNNPCGAAVGDTLVEAFGRAYACDPQSAYGGVIVINRPIDEALARELSNQFIEVLLAPGFAPEALAVLSEKKNVRLLELERWPEPSHEVEAKPVIGGQLVQTRDVVTETREQMRVVTPRAPSEREWQAMLFAWTVCRAVRSNAIVIAAAADDGSCATIGIGAGQMSRVDAVRIAVEKATDAQPQLLAGSALASDAFFPFADGPQLAIDAGVTAIIQPGGSVRDDDVIAAAEHAGVAMVATGIRHFRH